MSRKTGGLQLLRMFLSQQPARTRGLQPYSLEELNSANKKELGSNVSQSLQRT